MEPSRQERIIKWILSKEITVIPAPLDLCYFNAYSYSVCQAIQLVNKGFNLKMIVYLLEEAKREEFSIAMADKLGPVWKKAKEDFWFCLDGSKCDLTCSASCPDKKRKFIYSAGFKVEKNKKIGQGGFGSVYPGKIHGAEIAAKFIDVTDKYRGIFINADYYSPAKVMETILGDVAYEASVQSGFGHKNILKSKEWWLQLSMGKLIELVISTPKCYCNLKEWVDKEQFNFDQIRQFLVETTEALDYLAGQNLAHRDVKPSNILISDKKDPTVKLTDFGLMKSDGVTPVFCAPEQFVKNGTVIGRVVQAGK